MPEPAPKIQDETEVGQTIYWIEELHPDTGRYIRLANCDYGDRHQAITQASGCAFSEGRRLRVVEIKESMVASF